MDTPTLNKRYTAELRALLLLLESDMPMEQIEEQRRLVDTLGRTWEAGHAMARTVE